MFGIVSDESFESQLAELNGKKVEIQHIEIKHGRGAVQEVPSLIREIIATEAIKNGHTQEIAEAFGLSKSSVDAYKNGATSTATYNQRNEGLIPVIDRANKEVEVKAFNKLNAALDAITPERLATAKLDTVSNVAHRMSSVIRNVRPEETDNGNGIKQQFIIYQPRMKDEDEFEVIEVRE